MSKLIFLIFSLPFFTSKGYLGGSLILIDDWLKRDLFVFFGWFGLLFFPCAYLIISFSFTGIRFIFSWFIHYLASSYLKGCNFITVSVSTPSNSMGHSVLLFWGPESQGFISRWFIMGLMDIFRFLRFTA